MARKFSRKLVVDSDILCSSGNTNEDDRSYISRQILESILIICHRIVVTPALREEWKTHCSRYGITWLRQMRNKNKVVVLNDSIFLEDLRNQLPCQTLSAKQNNALEKDMHLLEAALETDRRIISYDESVHNYICKAKLDGVEKIIWVNPENDEDKCLEWLAGGAKEEKHRQLGYHY